MSINVASDNSRPHLTIRENSSEEAFHQNQLQWKQDSGQAWCGPHILLALVFEKWCYWPWQAILSRHCVWVCMVPKGPRQRWQGPGGHGLCSKEPLLNNSSLEKAFSMKKVCPSLLESKGASARPAWALSSSSFSKCLAAISVRSGWPCLTRQESECGNSGKKMRKTILTVSWAALGETLPSVWRKWSFPANQHWYGQIMF